MRANLSNRTVRRIRAYFNDNRIGNQGYSYSINMALEKILDLAEQKE